MSAIAFGLLAALSWGASAIVGTRLVRMAGTWTSIATTMLIGLALVTPFALASDLPEAPLRSWVYAISAGFCYVTASTCWLLAVRNGKVSVVTPIVSTDGAMAAIIVVAAYGETLRIGVAAALAVIVAGVVVGSVRRDLDAGSRFTGRELGLSLASAGIFGFAFVASAQAQEGLGVVWTLTASRISAVALLLPVALVLGGLRLPRTGIPFAVGMAALDLGGYAAFLAGVPASVAITSVLASQYAIVAVIGGFLALGERLTRLQTAGVALTVAGVATLAVLRA